MRKVLVLCTGNSCRSQMGEAILKSLGLKDVEIYSAGIEKHGLNPWAMKVLEELNIPIKDLYSKTLEELGDVKFDFVLTVCSDAHETCPVFIGDAKIIHQGFDDPPRLAKNLENENEILLVYRKVRDQIHQYLKNEFVIELNT